MIARLLLVCVLAGLPVLSVSAEPAQGVRYGIQLGVEQFTWAEWDPNDSSRQLLEEEGPRVALGLTLDNLVRPDEGLIYAAEVRTYYGEVDYDGETQGGAAVRTEVDYTGGLAEGRLGYRFPLARTGYGLDLLGGVGGEYWSRNIQDGYDASGNRARGYEEEYTVAYGKMGLALASLDAGDWYGRLEVGARYPLSVDERIDDLNADLSPGADPSPYATYEVSKRTSGGNHMGLTIYYETYRFNESPTATSDIGLVRQPESEMDVIGVRFGVFL